MAHCGTRMANVPPRGRSKAVERNGKKSFVFGSSTPRDFSYMRTVPATLRAYDSKVKPLPRAKDETLAHYMRKARTTSRNQSESREGSRDRTTRALFAFGSSTPRLLSHLYNVNGSYDDARINPQVGRRSYTTPTLPATHSKRVPTSIKVRVTRTQEPNSVQQKKLITSTTTTQITSTKHQPKEGSKEFMNSVKRKLEAQKDTKKEKLGREKKMAVKKKEPEPEKIADERAPKEKSEIEKAEMLKKSEKWTAEITESKNEQEASAIAKLESDVKVADDSQLQEDAVAQHQVSLLSLNVTPTQSKILQEVVQDSDVAKVEFVESLKNKAVEVLDEVLPAEEVTGSFHMGSIEHDASKDLFSFISRKVDGKELEHKDETESKISENSEHEQRERHLLENQDTVAFAEITSDPETYSVQPSFPQAVSEVRATDLVLEITNSSNPSVGIDELKVETELQPLSSVTEVKGYEVKSCILGNENIADPALQQHGSSILSKPIYGSLLGSPESDDASVVEKHAHDLSGKQTEEQLGSEQIICSYSCEYRSEGSQEFVPRNVQESFRPVNENTKLDEQGISHDQRWDKSTDEGVSAL